jgi:ABC-type Co2+ transport system permease subunit
MHIPDGFLSTFISIILWIVSIIAIGYSLKRVSQDIGERQVPLMGVLAAAIFAGQMLNFTVAGGTSGHLMGAAIATILLGPWAAVLVMTSVVSIQGLISRTAGCWRWAPTFSTWQWLAWQSPMWFTRSFTAFPASVHGASSLVASWQPGFPSRSLPWGLACNSQSQGRPRQTSPSRQWLRSTPSLESVKA